MIAKKTELPVKLALLKNLPLFAQTPLAELADFSSLFEDVTYLENEPVVLENDLVNDVLVIVSGEALVSYQGNQLAVLYSGETIGLNDTGIFSKTGARTATVTAITSLQALRLSLVDLKNFLAAHPSFLLGMQQSVDAMLRQHFIKKIEPFSRVNLETIQNVSEHIIEVDVPAGGMLFSQEDEADCCYLLVSGNVEVSMSDGKEEKIIAELNEDALIGELALLTANLGAYQGAARQPIHTARQ